MTDVVAVAFDDPRAAALLVAFGAEMDVRYPGSAASRADPDDFAGPAGVFLVALAHGVPVACGGLRPHSADGGEVKRMYVAPAGRGTGLGRRLLRGLVAQARAQGLARVVLECGTEQPEALGLYESEAFTPVPPYGQYADDPRCRCYGLSLR